MQKLLFVDDDTEVLSVNKKFFEQEGFLIRTAPSAKDAYTVLGEFKPDCILLDVMMPEVDGYTVAQRVRKNETTSNIPIIMLTALSQLNDKVKGFDIGVDDYLVKPFEMEELKVRVRALLKRSNQIPESAGVKELLIYNKYQNIFFI